MVKLVRPRNIDEEIADENKLITYQEVDISEIMMVREDDHLVEEKCLALLGRMRKIHCIHFLDANTPILLKKLLSGIEVGSRLVIMRSEGELAKDITIAVSPIPFVYLMPSMLQMFEERHKSDNINVFPVKCNSAEAFIKVERDECQIGIVAELPECFDNTRFETQVIGRDSLKLVVPNSYKSRSGMGKSIRLKEIVKELRNKPVKMILREEGSGTREFVLGLFGEDKQTILDETELILQSNETILAAVSRSDKGGITYLSLVSSVVTEELRPCSASLVDIVEDTGREFFAIRKVADKNAQELWDFMVGYLNAYSHMMRLVEIVEWRVKEIFPKDYLFFYRLGCRFCLESNNRVRYRIGRRGYTGIERIQRCENDDLRRIQRVDIDLRSLDLFFLDLWVGKIREMSRVTLFEDPKIAERIGDDLARTYMKFQRISHIVLPVIYMIMGSCIGWLLWKYIFGV